MANVALKIHGMDCAEEVSLLKREIAPLKGINELSFDVLNAKMTVSYAPEVVTPESLIEAVNRTGLKAELYEDARTNQKQGTPWDRWNRTVMTSASGVTLALGFLAHSSSVGIASALGESAQPIPLLARILYLVSTVTGAWFVFPKAWGALKRLRPDMNFLMTVAVIGALSIGEWFEAATVAFLFAVSLALESWSVSRARRAVAALMELSPTEARVIGKDGNEVQVAASEVQVGTRIIIKPGEKIPLDSKIVAGYTTIDQAPITGESMPVDKKVGDEIFAGTINQDGAIEAETVKPASQSTLSQIVKMVEEAQSKRSESEQWVERFARYYTPSVMVLATVIAIAPPLLIEGALWSKWFYEALVLLVIACPCALVIATPVSIVAALAAAAKNGILIKGGIYVELPGKLRAIALDKTGTLTEGRPSVEKIVPLSGHTENELLNIAAAIERPSEHPLARAIVQYASEKGINPPAVNDYQAVKGKGATALLNGEPVWVGSHRYLEERGVETPEMHKQLEELSSGGQSVVVIGERDHVCGFITLKDKLRESTPRAIEELKSLGIEHIIMLTGDNEPTARAIAQAAHVSEVRAELLPSDKVKAVEEIVAKYGIVAMVGDGVNDAPALARANLGIAMGAIGTDAALETADIALMKDDLSVLPWLINHSKRALSVIRQNIWAALGVKALFVALALTGYASLWAAIAADMGMSFLVVANSLRLLKVSKNSLPSAKYPSIIPSKGI